MVDGVETYVSRVCEKGIRIKMAFARTTAASILGSRGIVGTAGRGSRLGGWVTFCATGI